MSGFDATRSYAVSVQSGDAGSASGRTGTDGAPARPSQVIEQCFNFIQTFRIGEAYIYRDKLRANLLTKYYCLEVLHDHLIEFDQDLANQVSNTPGEVLPLFEEALRKAAKQILRPLLSRTAESSSGTQIVGDSSELYKGIPEVQITLRSSARQMPFRELDASLISKLVRIPGIVISASVLTSRASLIKAACKNCRNTIAVPVNGGYAGFTLPRKCQAPVVEGEKKDCPLDPYSILHDQSKFVDQQTIKLQEAPDAVPVGELPRHIILSVDRHLTGKVIPGSRVIATGIYSTFSSAKSGKSSGAVALRTPYLRVVGLEVNQDGASGSKRTFTLEEEDEFLQMSRTPDLYERFANSIAPSIYGNNDIKKAVLCLLFGGSKKVLPDGMRLRGDINVLLLGDPGTAKSQLLKFVEKVSPISVYTSGKGSSAAGLTASVQRDPGSREFYLEGGAMVLADGGVVCIDEFDKMRDEDRVAIHEAMEQQTISIAKAGITTILNSRTSVLAAANPVFGRYDDMKSAGDNIDFQTTILSRFDMIFVVKDEHDEGRDKTIARHVMNLHLNRVSNDTAAGEIDIDKMKRYIAYCKSRCAPRVSSEASEKLSSHFVGLRKQVQQVERDNDERSSIPMTVRQLEALIRISEALAKVTLSTTVSEGIVEEAIRLFRCSTMDAVQAGQVEGMTRKELTEEMNRVESDIRRRLPIGWSTSHSSLVNEFVHSQGYTAHALERTLYALEKREVIRFSGQRKTVHRIGV